MTLSIRRLVAVTFAGALTAGVASAQTTLTLNSPTHVTDTTIGSGTAANTVMNTARLRARTSTDVNATRRALVKFDTENTIPARTTITKATLTLFVSSGAGSTTRRIGVYPVKASFQESQATWKLRKTGYSWTVAGGDIGSKVTEASVAATAGTTVTMDVTAAVQAAVNSSGSRFTRLELIDIATADSTSYREFHSSETTDTARRPKLVVTYGTAAAPAPAPSTSSTVTTLKVLDWNTHYSGGGTDGVFDPDRVINWIVKFNPDIISLNEITRFANYDNKTDYSIYYRDQIQRKTGRTWYAYYRTGTGASWGHGNLVLSRFPFASKSYCQLSSTRVAVNAGIYVNGRLINFWSTHLDSHDYSSARIAETKSLLACTRNFSEQRIIAGDFNATSSTTEIGLMKPTYYDAWAEAVADGTAVSYPGNTSFGATRNGRIDYIWFSRGATSLRLKSVEVLDTRDANGKLPSDHKPLMARFEVR